MAIDLTNSKFHVYLPLRSNIPKRMDRLVRLAILLWSRGRFVLRKQRAPFSACRDPRCCQSH
uniref:Uncharacterized protein n=1 Tax=Rhizophora mucronata TaxID=61149 RepID=A0A2P2NNB3_RHIMU